MPYFYVLEPQPDMPLLNGSHAPPVGKSVRHQVVSSMKNSQKSASIS